MTVIIELKPETEAGLAALAAARGLGVREFVQAVLEEKIAPRQTSGRLSPAERAALWRAPVPGRPTVSALSDQAISRESIYDTRG